MPYPYKNSLQLSVHDVKVVSHFVVAGRGLRIFSAHGSAKKSCFQHLQVSFNTHILHGVHMYTYSMSSVLSFMVEHGLWIISITYFFCMKTRKLCVLGCYWIKECSPLCWRWPYLLFEIWCCHLVIDTSGRGDVTFFFVGLVELWSFSWSNVLWALKEYKILDFS